MSEFFKHKETNNNEQDEKNVKKISPISKLIKVIEEKEKSGTPPTLTEMFDLFLETMKEEGMTDEQINQSLGKVGIIDNVIK